MAELKILRVFLFLVFICLTEIRSQNLVNEDYYSFEDTSNLTETPTNNRDVVVQNSWTDELKRDSTSETAINIMETDVGSGEGDINQTEKADDLSAERYLFQEHAVNSTEDLPSAEDIFKVSENEPAEPTTAANDLETTKNEHMKQIFEKLGVTKDMVTDLFGATVTESIIQRAERPITSIEQITEAGQSVNINSLEEEFLLKAPVNGNLQLTNLEDDNFTDKRGFLERGTEVSSNNFDMDKRTENEFLQFITEPTEKKIKIKEDNVNINEKQRNTATTSKPEAEATYQTDAAIKTFYTTTPELDLITISSARDEDSLLSESVSSIETNYEVYGGSKFESDYKHQTKPENSATVDPALYEYEAHSNEEETSPLSATVATKVIKSTSAIIEVEVDKQNQTFIVEGINDHLDFDSTTTIAVISEEFTKEATESFLDENFHPTINIKTIPSERLDVTNLVFTNSDTEFATTATTTEETTDKIRIEASTVEPAVTFQFTLTPKENPIDELPNEALKTSTVTPNEGFTWRSPRNNEVSSGGGDIISITTHTPTARILTESVSLVTENETVGNKETIRQKSLSDPNVHPCLKLNFTGQLTTNESTILIPDNASMVGSCDSNTAFVNVTWQNEENFKATVFFNFTEDLLTNVQINMLNDNMLFEQSKRVELGSTSQNIAIEFENEHSLKLTFFEFSTRYDDSITVSSTRGYELASSSDELQSSTSLILLQIVVGCVGLVAVIAAAGFYAFKKFRGRINNFKPSTEEA